MASLRIDQFPALAIIISYTQHKYIENVRILDIGLDEGLKRSNAAHQTLEDLLLPDHNEDPLGEEWMETLDLEPFLDGVDNNVTEIVPSTEKVGVEVLDIPTLLSSTNTTEVKLESKKEGLKPSAFELLKALLTGQQPPKTEFSLDVPVEVQQTRQEAESTVTSPVAEVPFFDLSGCDSVNDDSSSSDLHPFENLIQPEISLGNGDIIEINISHDIDSSFTPSVQAVDTSSYISLSPLSNEADSVLSSGPSSPIESAEDFSTIDTSYLSDEASSSSVKSSQVSDESFTKLKSKSSKRNKVKTSPYDSDYETCNISDKRLRKKMQNKNAATRYRVKKRQEKETLQEQEVRLSDRNKELREKVESLQREIQYMKELMHEINKAKKSKI
ncbi:bZIP transcription factor [Mactra antiquata]